MPRPTAISQNQARRLALRAQGLDRPRPTGRIDRRHIRRVLEDVGLLQIDSVNVTVRAQYMPLFSRLGPYDRSLLDRMAYQENELFEYWGHVASLIPVKHHRLLRWRMADGHLWSSPNAVARERPELVAAVEAQVVANGPIPASALDEGNERKGPWWGWSDTKRVLEYLFHAGRIGAVRNGNFERFYCHPSHAVPDEVLQRPTPDEDTAHRELLLLAARAHGVGTARDLADVWRQPIPLAKRVLADLVAEGSLLPVEVEDWTQPAYLHPEVTLPRRVDACALVSPFDSAMWERSRIERLHNFDYRIEIYVPAPKRNYGYYVYPFLLGDTYVARVDLKADRKAGCLLVQAAHAEPDLAARGTDRGEVAARLADELRTMADWLDLDDVTVARRGNLAAELGAETANI